MYISISISSISILKERDDEGPGERDAANEEAVFVEVNAPSPRVAALLLAAARVLPLDRGGGSDMRERDVRSKRARRAPVEVQADADDIALLEFLARLH